MKPDNIEERIRDAMTGEQSMPRNEVWEGVIARRASGNRVVLPGQRKRLNPWWLIGSAAAVLVILSPLLESRKPEPSAPGVTVKPGAPKESQHLLLPGALMAQVSATPAYSTGLSMHGMTRPGRWVHGRFDDGVLKERSEFTMRHSTLNGDPAWLVLAKSNRQYNEWISADSTWFSADSMQPKLRITWVGETRFEQTYRADDILTGVTRNGYTSWSTTPQADPSRMFGSGSLFRSSEIGVRLQAMNLSATWRGSIQLPAFSEQPIPSLWINLIVDGEESVTVPGGTFECWRIRSVMTTRPLAKYDPANPPPGMYFWVSKERQWLIRMEYRFDNYNPDPLVLMEGTEE